MGEMDRFWKSALKGAQAFRKDPLEQKGNVETDPIVQSSRSHFGGMVGEVMEGRDSVMTKRGIERDIDKISHLFTTQAGLADASQFMKNIAATESNVGTDKMGDHSFSAFQLDPIRYKDIVQRAQTGAASTRANMVNEFLRNELDRPDFDILNMDLKKEGHNPLIGAALTRMSLANDPDALPVTLDDQATYWKENWNTHAKGAKGTTDKFKSQAKHHYSRMYE